MKTLEQITAGEFESYEDVRQSGLYNMVDQRAQLLSALDKETYLAVIKHYYALAAKWPEVIARIRAERLPS